MKLSAFTLKALKNFSVINEGIKFNKGNIQQVVAGNEELHASCTLPDEFPRAFNLMNVSKFIANVETFSDAPELEFTDHFVKIRGNAGSVIYGYAGNNVVKGYDEEFADPGYDISFKMSKDTLIRIQKFASINVSPNTALVSENKEYFVKAYDKKETTASVARLSLGKSDVDDFSIDFRTDNLSKLLDADYQVDLHQNELARFTYTEGASNIVYHLAADLQTQREGE